MRTAAPSAASTHGWSGMAKARLSGGSSVEVLFDDAAVEGLLEAVGGDEAEAFGLRPRRVRSAAWCHQYMTKSADSGTSGQAARRAST